jgi:hypothetical protein
MAFSRAICASRTAMLSMSRMSIGVLLLELVLVDADDHLLAAVDRACRRPPLPRCAAWACREATALVMPPIASTSSISASGLFGQFAVRLST